MSHTIKINSHNFEAVILLQSILSELNYTVAITGIFDRETEKATKLFQTENNLITDGIVGPKTWKTLYALSGGFLATTTSRFIGDIDLLNAALELNVELAAIKAVNQVESNGEGFRHDFPVTRFERHVFWKQLVKHGIDPNTVSNASNKDILHENVRPKGDALNERAALQRAQQIHHEAALESASWGSFQIMGYHWEKLGYQSIDEFVSKMKINEAEQLQAFVRYIKKFNLAKYIRLTANQNTLDLGNFADFASSYNGPNYKVNRYDTKMNNAYKKYLNEEKSVFKELFNVFKNTNWNQDKIHNAILTLLLDTLHNSNNVKERIPEYKKAFDVVRKRDNNGNYTLNSSMYDVRTVAQLGAIGTKTDFFIRDFMSLRMEGGEDASNPFLIGKNSSRNDLRKGYMIIDGMLGSDFSKHFNWMVEGINQFSSNQKVRTAAKIAHRDAIQLIPTSATIGTHAHFAGACMSHIHIIGNTISSKGSLQGIFASDGSFKNLHICNNSIDIQGQHYITINGMLSGKIEGNTNLALQPLGQDKIQLLPLRIQGGFNIYVVGFKNASGLSSNDPQFYAYEAISGSQNINDLRDVCIEKSGATNWDNVDMVKLQNLYPSVRDKVMSLKSQGASFEQQKKVWINMMKQVGTELTSIAIA